MHHRIQRLLKVAPDEKRVEPLLNPYSYGLSNELKDFLGGAFQIDYMGSREFESPNRNFRSFSDCLRDIVMCKNLRAHHKNYDVKRPSGFDYARDKTGNWCYDPDAKKLNALFAIVAPEEKMQEAVLLLTELTSDSAQTYEPTLIQNTVFTSGLGCDIGQVGAWFAMDMPALYFFDSQMFLEFHERLCQPAKYMKPALV